WETPFQSRAFVETWYRSYRSRIEPVLIFSMDAAAPALLALANGAAGLVVAGDHQAEYQAWLARKGDPEFLPRALQLLKGQFAFDHLSFKYLPPGFPLEVLPKGLFEVQRSERPLIRVDLPDELNASLKSKNNRRKLNGLKQHGEVLLEHVVDPGQWQRAL